MIKHEGSSYPVTTGEAILALRKFAKSATDYEKLILTWAADHLERETQGGDLISRSALYSKICSLPSNIGLYDADEVERILKEANAVDAVIPVRCGECKNWDTEKLYCHHPAGLSFCGKKAAVEGFCCFGERKED